MAEALLKQKLSDVEVQSAGIYAGEDEQANENTILALKDIGISLDHSSQPVTDHLLDWADFVLAMTTGHKQALILQHPNYQEKYQESSQYFFQGCLCYWYLERQSAGDQSPFSLAQASTASGSWSQ